MAAPTNPIRRVRSLISPIPSRALLATTRCAGALYERSGENDDDQIAFSTSTAGQTNNQNGQFDFNNSNPAGTGYDLADAALGLYYTYSEVGARSETPFRGNLSI